MAFEILPAIRVPALLQEEEYVSIPAPEGAFPSQEIVPLAPRRTLIEAPPAAILLDMDGTLTSTEPLFLLAIERAVASIAEESWPGLDPEVDHPALIGLSTADNIRYLTARYGRCISEERFARSLCAACGEVAHLPDADPARAEATLILGETALGSLTPDAQGHAHARALLAENQFQHAAVKLIYNQHYQALLREASHPRASSGLMLQPLPAVGLFLGIIKGALGEEAAALEHELRPVSGCDTAVPDILRQLGAYFALCRPPIGLVTSSTRREAEAVLTPVFHRLRSAAAQWPLSAQALQALDHCFEGPAACFDTIITASDIAEMRLKPHRDPYALALNALGVEPAAFHRVLGIEDTEAGVIALRAAGVSVACALPLPEARGLNLSAASVVAQGGLSELLLMHRLCLSQNLLTSEP